MTKLYPRFGLPDEQLAAIGSVCVGWGILDHEIGRLATYLLTAPYTSGDQVVSGTIGFRDRLKLIRGLAHDFVSNRKAFGELDSLLTFIGSNLGPERNRVVHDVWLSGGFHRVQLKPRFSKKRHQEREMAVFHETEVKLTDLYSLAQLIADVGTAVARAATNYVLDKENGPDTWPDIFVAPLQSLNERYRPTMKD